MALERRYASNRAQPDDSGVVPAQKSFANQSVDVAVNVILWESRGE